MQPLAVVAAHMRGDPGAFLLGETRRVATAAEAVYLVPTTRGWVCMQGQRFATCHRGLLRQGISWNFESEGDGVDVVGIAADDVSGVALEYGKTEQQAVLHDNVFFVHRPATFTPGQHSFPLGTLTIRYRDGRPKASVALR